MRWHSWIVLLLLPVGAAWSAEPPSPERGYRLLTTKAYLPADFDQQTFDDAWRSWEEPLRTQAKAATPDERREMAYRRYGLTAQTGTPSGGSLQYVVDERGNWSMSCLACHQGKVAGRVIAGVPNSHFALETLTADIRLAKIRLGKKFTRMDIGSLLMPLGTSNGTTNAVMFGVVLMNYRDADLNLDRSRPIPQMTHHDHDAPAWWNVKKKTRLYCDSFAPKSHRALMQFLLVEENGPEQFRAWEKEFEDVQAYIESLEPPPYPYPVDRDLANAGRQVFRRVCAECHGTYGPDGVYPEKIVPIDVVETDPVRLEAITVANRRDYGASWFGRYGQLPTVVDPGGYVAPPLDGIWASGPYLHNGSVPTLWHILHPAQRAKVWRRSEDGYDRKRVGLEITQFEEIPADVRLAAERRQYFDARVKGKSAAGHDFAEVLEEPERRAVLEFLKTL